MGCFGYICNKCGKNIRDGEKAVLRHVRHGEILGETIGEYDSYGRVYEDSVFRSWEKEEKSYLNINSHEEICKSEFDLYDSKERETKNLATKDFNGEEVGLDEYLKKVTNVTIEKISFGEATKEEKEELLKCIKDYNDLPEYENPTEAKSGTVAFHAKCYKSLGFSEEELELRKTPSEIDPDQGCGTPRKQFI